MKPLKKKKNTDHCHKEERDQQKRKRNHLLLYKVLLSTKSWEQLRCPEYRVSSHKSSGTRDSSHMSGKCLAGQPKPRPAQEGPEPRVLLLSTLVSGLSASVQLARLSTEQEASLWRSQTGIKLFEGQERRCTAWNSHPVMAGEGIFITSCGTTCQQRHHPSFWKKTKLRDGAGSSGNNCHVTAHSTVTTVPTPNPADSTEMKTRLLCLPLDEIESHCCLNFSGTFFTRILLSPFPKSYNFTSLAFFLTLFSSTMILTLFFCLIASLTGRRDTAWRGT